MPQARLAAAAIGSVLGFALLSGCADMRDEVQNVLDDNEPRTLAFECDDDRDFSVRLTGDRDEARVDVGQETYELNLADRDEGRRVYSNEDDVRLTIGDNEANLRIPGGEDYRNCERV
jgi:hypothetical protein